MSQQVRTPRPLSKIARAIESCLDIGGLAQASELMNGEAAQVARNIYEHRRDLGLRIDPLLARLGSSREDHVRTLEAAIKMLARKRFGQIRQAQREDRLTRRGRTMVMTQG